MKYGLDYSASFHAGPSWGRPKIHLWKKILAMHEIQNQGHDWGRKHRVNYLCLFIICMHCMRNCMFLMSFHVVKILKAFLIRLIVVNSIIKHSAHNEHNIADTHNVRTEFKNIEKQNLYYSMQHGNVHYVI